MTMRVLRTVVCLGVAACAASTASAHARMFRFPAVSKTQVAFVYAGDIWVVPKAGGAAVRLTSSPGEESFPRFSPDGRKIAYSARARTPRRCRRGRCARR